MAQPGLTQDLTTGQEAEPEVVQRSLPAAQVDECIAMGPLADDPSVTYKKVRLQN